MMRQNRIYVVLLVLVSFWCIGFLAAPLFKHHGYEATAHELYSFYSRVCHQQDTRSFHIEDEKCGVCARCTSLYFGFLGGLISVIIIGKGRSHRIPRRGLILIPLTLMLLDVGWRIATNSISSDWSRVCTGALFGFAASWFIIPLFNEAVLQLIRRKNNQSSKNSGAMYARETA